MLAAILVVGLTVTIAACGRDRSPGLGERVIPFGQPVPKGGGRYHVGEPYGIGGVRYYPREDPNYDRVGQASWYGELFHGRYTANGEIYDMDRLSAAHPTLPLPVYAYVTNLENGRSLVVRVNDRGPFKKNRIIDLSRRSAEVLGFRKVGTARVRVRYLRRAPLNGDDSYERQYLSSRGYQRYASNLETSTRRPEQNPIAVASHPGRNGPPPLPDRPERPVATAASVPAPAPARESVAMGTLRTDLRASYETTGSTATAVQPTPHLVAPADGPAIQAGSFKNKENAERAQVLLSGIGPVDIAEVDVDGETYYRVQVGPFADDIAAAAALSRVTKAGYHGAKILLRN